MISRNLLQRLIVSLCGGLIAGISVATPPEARSGELPEPGSIVVDPNRRELVLSAKVQFPEDKPCINEYWQRVQAFGMLCWSVSSGSGMVKP